MWAILYYLTVNHEKLWFLKLVTWGNYANVLRQGLDAEDGVGEEFVTGRLILEDLHQDVEASVGQEDISQQLSRSGANMNSI